MYVITNRRLDESKDNLDVFEKYPNTSGPNELRLLSLSFGEEQVKTTVLDDQLSVSRIQQINKQFKLSLDVNKPWYASLDVACKIFKRAKDEKKQVLVYVHGYNNDISDIVKTAQKLETLYNVIVVPFTWPANGGGALSGTASYKSDKRDARVSTGALDTFMEKLYEYHHMLTAAQQDALWKKATTKHRDDNEMAREVFSRLQKNSCKVSISLLCHSMGCYLFKHSVLPSNSTLRKKLIFDNVCLVSADANNKDHKVWVEEVDTRVGLYIVINENDSALKWSRRKPGEEQLARLGHYIKGLNSTNGTYIDVTDTPHVHSEHSYFKDDPVEKNKKLSTLFSGLFEGRRPEKSMKYKADSNTYVIK